MKTLTITSEIIVYESITEIPDQMVNLIKSARGAALQAYAPYSHFKVGAAILLNNGEIVTGNNQENAVYPCGLCAERTAAFSASSQYPEVPFHLMAITAINPIKPLTEPISPCGSCRQVLFEYEQKFQQPIGMLLCGETGPIYYFHSIKDLLPYTFHAGFLP